MIHILHAMSNAGWHLAAATDLSKKSWDKDSLMFRAGPPVHRIIFAVTFNVRGARWARALTAGVGQDPHHRPAERGDPGRVHPGRGGESPPSALTQTHWPNGIQDQKVKEERCYQIKLKGNPWYAGSAQQVNDARFLTLGLLTTFDHMGYELVGCLDMNTGTSEDNRDSAWPGGGADSSGRVVLRGEDVGGRRRQLKLLPQPDSSRRCASCIVRWPARRGRTTPTVGRGMARLGNGHAEQPTIPTVSAGEPHGRSMLAH